MLYRVAIKLLLVGAAVLIAIVIAFLVLLSIYSFTNRAGDFSWIIAAFTIPLTVVFVGVFCLLLSLIRE